MKTRRIIFYLIIVGFPNVGVSNTLNELRDMLTEDDRKRRKAHEQAGETAREICKRIWKEFALMLENLISLFHKARLQEEGP